MDIKNAQSCYSGVFHRPWSESLSMYLASAKIDKNPDINKKIGNYFTKSAVNLPKYRRFLIFRHVFPHFSILRDIYLMKSRLSAAENLKSEYNPQTENNYLKTNKMGKKVFVTRKTLKTVFEVMTYVSLLIDFLKWYGYFMPLF